MLKKTFFLSLLACLSFAFAKAQQFTLTINNSTCGDYEVYYYTGSAGTCAPLNQNLKDTPAFTSSIPIPIPTFGYDVPLIEILEINTGIMSVVFDPNCGPNINTFGPLPCSGAFPFIELNYLTPNDYELNIY